MQFSTVDDLVKWFKEYPHVVEGEELFAGRPAFRVAIKLTADVTQYVWLDKKTFLPVGGRSVNKQGGEATWTERLEVNLPIDPAIFNYQPPDGFVVEELKRR
jgi:outer membrane lipoprotein-sorting protein